MGPRTLIDLRSDTITQPTPEMRVAIAEAMVGDDVYHDDPTVNELETAVAKLLGKEDAMFVPTGTMANQIAVRAQTEPGDSVIIERSGHIGVHELGGAAHLSGVTLQRIAGNRGTFTSDQVEELVPVPHPSLPGHLYDPVTLVCFENTHNAAGGTIWPVDLMKAVSGRAAELGLRRHLDGARLWNASVASGIPLSTFASFADTVNVCFSKGLGAPVGSALVGDADLIERARRFKHMFGGGFRQAGLLAAGALYAINNHMERLADDHTNARTFAESLAAVEGVSVDLDAVQTNIVYAKVGDPGRLVDESLDKGVAMLVSGPGEIRAVFSLAVDAHATADAVDVVTGLARTVR
jgi:threonine aldolase